MRVGIIINPRAGVHRAGAVGHRQALAKEVLRAAGIEGRVVVSEGRGRGREATQSLLDEGLDAFVVWGGDGTINEVASPLVGRDVPLGIVPAGSGNGLARELGLEWHPRRALETALSGPTRSIDVGELGGRFFFNVAGIGLDAHLAQAFDRGPRRGLRGYVTALVRELRSYDPQRYRVTADTTNTAGLAVEQKALIVALANTRQYGNRAIIAPLARPDDGLLDLVVVPPLSPATVAWQVRRLFTGTVHRVPGVLMHSVREGQVRSDAPLTFHLDGEVDSGTTQLSIGIRPGALRVRVPR